MGANRILIADSGSTKTQWALLEGSTTIGHYSSFGINPNYQRSSEILEVLDEVTEFRDANFCNSVEQVFFYGAGCHGEENSNTVEIALQKRFVKAKIKVESDMFGAARSLCNKKKGIACILGTGSNSCFYDGNIVVANVPSYGYLFGDHGSGAVLGKTLIEAFCSDLLPLDLKEKLEKETGITREILLLNVYKKAFPNRYLASFVPFIHAHIENEFIHQMVVMSFADFLHFQVSKYPEAKSLEINFTGSVAYLFSKLLEEVLASAGYKMGVCIQHPLEGLITYHKQN